MDKLQLALLTSWAEDAGLRGIQGRKRMQKVIYFLQQAGCPIQAEYTLHHYGPYSREVADITDTMVAEGLLKEERGEGGLQYNYQLGDRTREMLDRIGDSGSAQALKAFEGKAVELLGEKDPWLLELGSTILYFYHARHVSPSWDRALSEACSYKRVDLHHPRSKAALALAKRFSNAVA